MFESDPNVLYFSIHRYDQGAFYPGGPEANYTFAGVGPGLGRTVNVPWPMKGLGDADYLHVFYKLLLPIAFEFAPDLVFISAGFDAAVNDVIGECRVSSAGFAHMTYLLKGLARGRVVMALEVCVIIIDLRSARF